MYVCVCVRARAFVCVFMYVCVAMFIYQNRWAEKGLQIMGSFYIQAELGEDRGSPGSDSES